MIQNEATGGRCLTRAMAAPAEQPWTAFVQKSSFIKRETSPFSVSSCESAVVAESHLWERSWDTAPAERAATARAKGTTTVDSAALEQDTNVWGLWSKCPVCSHLLFADLDHTTVSSEGAIAFTPSVPSALSKPVRAPRNPVHSPSLWDSSAPRDTQEKMPAYAGGHYARQRFAGSSWAFSSV